MPADKPDFEAFWRSHVMCNEISDAAIALMAYWPLYRPPLPDARLEQFRKRMQGAYERAFPDNTKAPRPSLRLVNNGD